jgi:hypothetical protein
MQKQRRKVIHSGKNLFCNVGHICNLVQEFNGLVSKRVDRKVSPFYFIKIASFSSTCFPFLRQLLSVVFNTCSNLNRKINFNYG